MQTKYTRCESRASLTDSINVSELPSNEIAENDETRSLRRITKIGLLHGDDFSHLDTTDNTRSTKAVRKTRISSLTTRSAKASIF